MKCPEVSSVHAARPIPCPGHPYLSDVKVTAEVLRNTKGKKIRIFKYNAKKHYRLSKGHRQKYTDIHITEVAGIRVPSKVNLEAATA